MLGKCALTLNRVAIGVWVGAVGFMFVAGLAVLAAMPTGTVFVALGDETIRVSAGDIVGTIFRQYYAIGAVLGGLAFSGAVLSWRSGNAGGVSFAIHVVSLAVMLLCLLLDAGYVYGKVHGLAEQIPEEGLRPENPIYAEFWKWHGISMLLSLIVLGVGVIAAAAAAWPSGRASDAETHTARGQ